MSYNEYYKECRDKDILDVVAEYAEYAYNFEGFG
jgi:hypothetical protein